MIHSLAGECGASGRWCEKKRGRSSAIPAALPSASCLPLMLILLFGYGLSLDVKDVPLAVVLEDPSPEATELAAGVSAVAVFRRATADLDAQGAAAHAGREKWTGSSASAPISPGG